MRCISILFIALAFIVFPLSEARGDGKKSRSSAPTTVHVKSYTKKDGTQVGSHYRSAPRSSSRDGARTNSR